MARGLNRLTLFGNMGNDPELRYTAENVAMASCSLAVAGERRPAHGGGDRGACETRND